MLLGNHRMSYEKDFDALDLKAILVLLVATISAIASCVSLIVMISFIVLSIVLFPLGFIFGSISLAASISASVCIAILLASIAFGKYYRLKFEKELARLKQVPYIGYISAKIYKYTLVKIIKWKWQ